MFEHVLINALSILVYTAVICIAIAAIGWVISILIEVFMYDVKVGKYKRELELISKQWAKGARDINDLTIESGGNKRAIKRLEKLAKTLDIVMQNLGIVSEEPPLDKAPKVLRPAKTGKVSREEAVKAVKKVMDEKKPEGWGASG